MQTVDDYINAAQRLAPAPPILPQLLPLLHQPNTDSSKVVDLISYDQSLTASVLRICNSAYFNPGDPIDSLQYAVIRIGLRQIYDIVVSVMFSDTLGGRQEGYCAGANQLWQHSVTAAVAAQLIAHDMLVDEQVVFTAAILHDIGKIILSQALKPVRDQVACAMDQNGLSSLEMEMKLLGVSHAEVGSRLLERWQLPENLVAGVRHHHQPSAAAGHERLTACVNLGDCIAYFMGRGYGKHSLDLTAAREAGEIIDLSAERISQYVDETGAKLQQIKHVYNI